MGKHGEPAPFHLALDAFTRACRRGANWRHVHSHAAFRRRVAAAVAELEAAIAAARRDIIDTGPIREQED